MEVADFNQVDEEQQLSVADLIDEEKRLQQKELKKQKFYNEVD